MSRGVTDDYLLRSRSDPGGLYDINNSDNILEVINDTANQLIYNIKKTLGQNITETDTNVGDIYNLLQGIENTINTDIASLKATTGNDQRIYIDANGDNKYEKDKGEYYKFIDQNDDFKKYKFEEGKNLDDSKREIYDTTNANFENDQLNTNELNISNPDDRKQLETRLTNCQSLEVLYLKKHDELMDTFAFTLKLYNKYSNAIQKLNLVLQRLVQKKYNTTGEAESTEENKIRLPKALIKDIGRLVKDQDSVKKTIDNMKDKLQFNLTSGTPSSAAQILADESNPI